MKMLRQFGPTKNTSNGTDESQQQISGVTYDYAYMHENLELGKSTHASHDFVCSLMLGYMYTQIAHFFNEHSSIKSVKK